MVDRLRAAVIDIQSIELGKEKQEGKLYFGVQEKQLIALLKEWYRSWALPESTQAVILRTKGKHVLKIKGKHDDNNSTMRITAKI